MRLEIEFQSTPEQFSEVARELKRVVYRNQSEELMKRVTPPIVICLVLILVKADPPLSSFVAGAIACYAWLWFWGYWRYAKDTTERWTPDANMWSLHRAVITDKEIQLLTSEMDTTYRWPTFRSWSDSTNYVVLWQDGYALLALPKSALDHKQREELLNFLAEAKLPQI